MQGSERARNSGRGSAPGDAFPPLSAIRGSGRVCLGRLRPVLRPWRGTLGPLGTAQGGTVARRVSQARRDGRPPSPPARALRARRSKLLFGRRSGRRQDDARSDRRGAAARAGVEADEIGRRPIPMIRIAITAAAYQCHLLDAARGAPRWPLEMPRRALARIGRRILIWPLIVRVHHTGVVTAVEAVMAVCAAVHSPARVKTAPTKSACMKTRPVDQSRFKCPKVCLPI